MNEFNVNSFQTGTERESERDHFFVFYTLHNVTDSSVALFWFFFFLLSLNG